MAGLWFSQSTPIFSTNKTDHHYITEIFLKVGLNTIQPTLRKFNTFTVKTQCAEVERTANFSVKYNFIFKLSRIGLVKNYYDLIKILLQGIQGNSLSKFEITWAIL